MLLISELNIDRYEILELIPDTDPIQIYRTLRIHADSLQAVATVCETSEV